jgi:hypothetical protein
MKYLILLLIIINTVIVHAHKHEPYHEGRAIAPLEPSLGYATALTWMILYLESKN